MNKGWTIMKATQQKRERETLEAALQKLCEEVPVGEYEVKWEVLTGKGTGFDAVVSFNRILHEYAVAIIMNINPKMIDALKFYLAAAGRTVILVTDAITDRTAGELKQRGIQFIDTLGNIYLTQEDPFVLVHKIGNRPRKTVDERPGNAFVGTRLRVIFALLTIEDAVNFTYRKIAGLAGVALGTVGWTFRDLKILGYIRVYKHKRKIMNRDKLVNRWLEAYPTEIRPKLDPKRFTAPDKNWWIQTDLNRYGAILGGETAAAVLTKYLHPEHGVLYMQGDRNELAIALKLRADPRGNLTVMDRFWGGETLQINQTPIAPQLLVCAELLAEGGERNMEVVKMIKESHSV
ncbi:MAG: hypothetical protein KAS73_01355 [Candidatus Sabulitectum sp.]|nr:hypothetical protein [Candidatus Sabulitectum sp.]